MSGQYNTRIETGSTTTSLGIAGIGVAGLMVAGKTHQASTKDRRYVNCFYHTVGKHRYCIKRPGHATHTTPSAGNIGNAILIWTGQGTGQKVITAFGATNSTIYDGTTSLGAITGVCTGITETFVGTEPTLVISSKDNTAWTTSGTGVTGALTFTGDTHTNTTVDNISSTSGLVVGQLLTGTGFAANTRIASIDSATAITTTVATTATNAGVTITRTILGKIVDADFPGNAGYTLAGTFAHIDGYPCIMTTDGKLWAGNLNTVTGWTATSYDSANAYPDKGIGCVRHRNFIMAFGSESIQFFYNTGSTPFPLSKAVSMTIKIGAIPGDSDADTIAQISDSVFWCGSTPQGGLSIYRYDGGIQRISTPEIDAAMVLIGPDNISLTTRREYGLSFVLVRASATTYVYCIEEKDWHEWTPGGDLALWYKCAGLSSGSSMVTYSISNTSTSGKVYKTDPANLVFTDDGNAYTSTIQTANEDLGTNRRKFYPEITLVCDRETTSSPITVSYTDNDFQSFTTYGNLDLSDELPKATRLGSSKKRAWRLEHSANTGFRLEAIEGQVEIGQ